MGEYARIDSIDALLALKVALIKFAENTTAGLTSAESDMQRTLQWLEHDQQLHWKGQIRLWHERVQAAIAKLSEKRMYKNVDGTTPSTVDEERALAIARRRFQEAEEKLQHVKRWIPRLRKAIDQYHAGVARLRTQLTLDIPLGQARLERMAATLRKYTEVAPLDSSAMSDVWRDAMESVARPMPHEQAPAAEESPEQLSAPDPQKQDESA